MITTIKEWKLLKENKIEIISNLNKLYFWHGGNLDNIYSNQRFKSNRIKYGIGLYLTDNYNVVQDYIKGNRKLYLVEIEKGTPINKVNIDINTVDDFLYTILSIKNHKQIMVLLQQYIKNNKINASLLNNVLINNHLLKPKYTEEVKKFYIKHGIDYEIIDNAFGWHDTMLVLYNTNKVLNFIQITNKNIPDIDNLNLKPFNTYK